MHKTEIGKVEGAIVWMKQSGVCQSSLVRSALEEVQLVRKAVQAPISICCTSHDFSSTKPPTQKPTHPQTYQPTNLPTHPPTHSATQPNLKMQLHQTQPQTHPTAHGTALPNKAKFSRHRIKSQLSSQLISICGPLHTFT